MRVAVPVLMVLLLAVSPSRAGWCPLSRSACGIEGLPASVVEGIIRVESGGNPWALHVGISKGYGFYPKSRAEAWRLLVVSLALTDNVDVGLMQINWRTWGESVRALAWIMHEPLKQKPWGMREWCLPTTTYSHSGLLHVRRYHQTGCFVQEFV